jgi:hypothetical protein
MMMMMMMIVTAMEMPPAENFSNLLLNGEKNKMPLSQHL